MIMELNGKKHFETFVSEEEMAVIKAMRLGGKVDIDFHGLTEMEEVDERMNMFADFERSGLSWIEERENCYGKDYISFYKDMGNMNVACYLDLEKD